MCPARNAFTPAPVTIATHRSSSAAKASKAASIATCASAFRTLLAAGRLMVMTVSVPFHATATGSAQVRMPWIEPCTCSAQRREVAHQGCPPLSPSAPSRPTPTGDVSQHRAVARGISTTGSNTLFLANWPVFVKVVGDQVGAVFVVVDDELLHPVMDRRLRASAKLRTGKRIAWW
jgi:hypothetical protein